MSTIVFIILLAIEIFCGVIMRSIAEKRGANKMTWFIVGLVIGPLAFIFIPFFKKNKIN